MVASKIIAGIFLAALGAFFFGNYKANARNLSKALQKYYTEKNLKIAFRVLGVILFVSGLMVAVIT